MSNVAPHSIEALEELLSRPTSSLVDMMRRVDGDVIVLGVGGKMGPTLARMARRACDEAGTSRRIFGVSRFSQHGLRDSLEGFGIETISCDLLDEDAVRRLPDAANVISMSGFKFGAARAATRTWATNCLIPINACRRFTGSRIVAFSTGNVYGPATVESGGSRESDIPQPIGEYAMAALGRERLYEYFSETGATSTAVLRLNYATELRYGVLVDIGQKILAGVPVDVSTSWVNVIWQGDANAMALRALEQVSSPARTINLAGRELLRVRDVALRFGAYLRRPVEFVGQETAAALLSNGSAGYEMLGLPSVDSEQMIEWTADWLSRGGPTLGKPTMFQVRDGNF